MPYLDLKIITEAKQMDLLTYLRNYDPNELVHVIRCRPLIAIFLHFINGADTLHL